MRITCLDCVRKHLAQASVLMDESYLGYPHHFWFAVGHMAEAESECLSKFPKLAYKIRLSRMLMMNKQEDPNFDDLILEVSKASGSDYLLDPLNSKKFDNESKKKS